MRRITPSSTISSRPLRRPDARASRGARRLAVALLSVASGLFLACESSPPTRANLAPSGSASALATSKSAKPSDSADALRGERAAAFVTFYESFVRAVADNADDCDAMGAALTKFTDDEANVKRLAGIDEDAADDPRLATEVDKLTNAVDQKYPRFDDGLAKCGKNEAVRAAMKKIALAP